MSFSQRKSRSSPLFPQTQMVPILFLPLTTLSQTPGIPQGGGSCTTNFDCSLGGTCDANKCTCDQWWTGESCALLNLQAPEDDQGGTCGDAFDSYFSWGGRAVPDNQGQWHLYASFICDHKDLSKWTTQSSSAHFIANNATGPFEFSPEQCEGDVCTPAVIPWSHNTVATHNITKSQNGAEDAWQIWHIGDGIVNASIWGPCFNKSDVGGRAKLLRAAQDMADAFDCTPFGCTCQGFADYYGVNQAPPNYGNGCSPPDALAWSASRSCKGLQTTGRYCGGVACTPQAKQKYCTQVTGNRSGKATACNCTFFFLFF